MKAICVICGSNAGRDPRYASVARELGQELASRGLTLVYGGAGVGLMGAVADATLDAGGEAIGIITAPLAEKVGHPKVQVETVPTLHERKRRFSELADAYVALPGGFGTLDELFEAVTWNQLGIHERPTGLLNVAGFYDPLMDFLRRVSKQGFVRQQHLASILIGDAPNDLLGALQSWTPPDPNKWKTDE
ncbi:MAG: TIGR00730 family Rossman fold protein [Gammaproteobacteria bacterium]|nr:TIGR00730 family Rossman fold protein [Gammaproteobacteria bacterium]